MPPLFSFSVHFPRFFSLSLSRTAWLLTHANGNCQLRKLPRGETDRGVITDTAEWTNTHRERTIRKQTTALIVKSATVRCSASCPFQMGPTLVQKRSHLSFLPSSYRLIGQILRCLWRLVACCSRFATILIASSD